MADNSAVRGTGLHAAGWTVRLPGRTLSAWMVSCALALSGCAGTRTPADWPAFVQAGVDGECAALTGQYGRFPSAQVGKEPVLSSSPQAAYWDARHDWTSWLFNSPGRSDLSIEYLTIRHEGADRIVISGIHPEVRGEHPVTVRNVLLVRSHTEVEIPAGTSSATFSCKDGFIKVSNFGFLPLLFPVAPAGMVQTKFIHLRKAVDGSLIVHAGYDTYPTLPLVPLPLLSSVDGYDGWYRHAPYTQQSDSIAPDIGKSPTTIDPARR